MTSAASLPVFIVDSLAGARVGSLVEVGGDEARHAAVVRRIRPGEQVRLTDGAGSAVVGPVESAAPRQVVVRVAHAESLPRAAPRFIVAQAIAKGDRSELAVEMLTEIGVDVIIPWAASRSVAVWRGDRVEKSLARWRSTAREAAKQARRSWLPDVRPLASTSDVANVLADADLGVVLHEAASDPLAAWTPPWGHGAIVVVVGPEGGITNEELGAFEASGGRAVRLGPTVLRTSTAGVAAVAAILTRTSRWSCAGADATATTGPTTEPTPRVRRS